MLPQIWIPYLIVVLALICIEAMLYVWRSRRSMDVGMILKRAKEETQEIAQLPLNNPHPQIQISNAGKVLFANPATLRIFPGIESKGFDHPVLSGVQEAEIRDITFDTKTYQQTITQTQVSGEQAYVVYCYDVTDRRRYERELQSAHKRAESMRAAAEDAKDARGEFLANMSHELRTPMNGIIGLSDILAEAGLKGENQHLIEAVNSSARNLLILLNDILDFSKIEAGELTIEKIPFDIRKVIQQIESLQHPMAIQKGLRMHSLIEDTVPRFLIGDPSRLQQIFNNLISNALKFTESGSVTLRVFGEVDGQGLFNTHIAVQDTGIGIPKEKQAAVFEKFQQADTSTARKYGGTGLGLSITKDLTELMGGRISIESEEGVGTIFTVCIPATIADTKYHSDNDADAYNMGINTDVKMMIVDDHPINLLFMRKTLSKMGFENFDEATSGKQALELFNHKQYDVIIMDCQMPDMDGFEASRHIRQLESIQTQPTIIAATADAMKGAEEKCIAAGMNDYISKPIDKDKLGAILARWIPGESQISEKGKRNNEVQEETQNVPEAEIDTKSIDFEYLLDFTEGDQDVEKQILDMFSENLKSDIQALHKSLRRKEYEEWDYWVHKIYGACSHIGANPMAAICDEGQTLVPDNIQQIPQTHEHILNEYRRVQKVLKERNATV